MFFKFENRVKDASQFLHLYSILLCILLWAFNDPDCVKDALHVWHLKGFSPVWILVCTVKF